jgi:hypothetical protein
LEFLDTERAGDLFVNPVDSCWSPTDELFIL